MKTPAVICALLAASLSAPPRGDHWVQNGADYVPVAVATGIILQLLLNN